MCGTNGQAGSDRATAEVIELAREVHPSQPLTSGVFQQGFAPIGKQITETWRNPISSRFTTTVGLRISRSMWSAWKSIIVR